VDVEDWFQVENFKPWIPFSSWSSYELRVEKNTHRLLDLFDSYISIRNLEPGTQNPINATFFVLGWLADRLPTLIREIHARGHEVASHGFYHHLPIQQSNNELKRDIIDSKKLLEDITGAPVFGYRAPSFNINDNALKIIEECGYTYDSSYNSFRMHERYGNIDLARRHKNGAAIKVSNNFYELPISNLKIGKRVIPFGGGGYFRLIPFSVFKIGVQKLLAKENSYVFYMHPWEIDPEQPRVNNASLFYKFRHYVNLSKAESKLIALIKNFSENKFTTCRDYLDQIVNGY